MLGTITIFIISCKKNRKIPIALNTKPIAIPIFCFSLVVIPKSTHHPPKQKTPRMWGFLLIYIPSFKRM
jgi:hypothetical protein